MGIVPEAKPMIRICAPQLTVLRASWKGSPPTGSYSTSTPCGATFYAQAAMSLASAYGNYNRPQPVSKYTIEQRNCSCLREPWSELQVIRAYGSQKCTCMPLPDAVEASERQPSPHLNQGAQGRVSMLRGVYHGVRPQLSQRSRLGLPSAHRNHPAADRLCNLRPSSRSYTHTSHGGICWMAATHEQGAHTGHYPIVCHWLTRPWALVCMLTA